MSILSKFFSVRCVSIVSALWTLAVIAGAPLAASPVVPFTFARVTDTHIGENDSHVAEDAAEVQAINCLSPHPDFVINCGDLVDAGTPELYASYRQVFSKLTMPLYDAPGNHDVRWSPLGKKTFVDTLHEPMYRSFDYNGCHFILLDTSVVLEGWGHFDAEELNWLRRDLKKTGKQTPIFLFFHHWVGRNATAVDNESEFYDVIKPYNVKIIFCGHGHYDVQWRLNGVQYVMERALYSGSFDYASVTPSAIMLYRCRKEDGRAAKLLAIVPIAPQPHVSFDASVKQKGNDITIKANAPGNPALICRIDTQQFEGDVAPNKWIPLVNGELHLDASTLSPGLHSLFVRAQYALPAERASEFQDTEGGGDPWQKTLELRISSTAPRVVWSRKLGGMAQSRLLYNDGIVYVPCLDHKLYALDASTGKSRWKFKTGDLVYSTPEIEDGVLYFGSADHYVYALNPQTGKLIWKAETGGPVYASLKVGDGIACVGCGDEKAYGFDAKTGEQKWVAPLSGFVQAQAEFANDTFYLGAWDNTFYALDASTGQQRWTDHIGKRLFYSPAIARPTIYNDHIYVVSDDNTLHVLDLKTGHEDWTARCAVDDNRYGNSTPLILGDRLYLGCLGDGGVVDSLNAETGANIWTLRTGNDISDSSPISDGKRIYIGSVNGDFYCLDPATGAIQWTYHLGPGHLVATAATDGIDTAYIASMSDTVYALRTP